MREILFRGKTKVTNRWVYGYFSRNFGDASPQIRDVNDCCYNAVNSETVGQYTGLTDKNGKKIFEGDIFKFDDEVCPTVCAICEDCLKEADECMECGVDSDKNGSI